MQQYHGMKIFVQPLIPIKICSMIIFAIKRWHFKFRFREGIVTGAAWHVTGMTAAVSGILFRITTIILLQICECFLHCIELVHESIEGGPGGHLCEVNLIEPLVYRSECRIKSFMIV